MTRRLFILLVVGCATSAFAQSPAGEIETRVLDAAREELAARWPSLSARADVRLVRLSGLDQPAASPLRVRFLLDSEPRGRTSAEIMQRDGGAAWRRTGWLLLNVVSFDDVPILTRDVSRGDRIERYAYSVESVETTGFAHAPLPLDTLSSGDWTASRDLLSGTVLTRGLVEPPTAALRGDAVHFRYERGAVAVDLIGEARERGAVGDVIRVYNSDTRTTHRVRMTAPGEGVWSGR